MPRPGLANLPGEGDDAVVSDPEALAFAKDREWRHSLSHPPQALREPPIVPDLFPIQLCTRPWRRLGLALLADISGGPAK